MDDKNLKSKEEIKIVVNEDGKNLEDLNISAVFDHTINSTSKDNNVEKKEIVIPKSSSDKKNKVKGEKK